MTTWVVGTWGSCRWQCLALLLGLSVLDGCRDPKAQKHQALAAVIASASAAAKRKAGASPSTFGRTPTDKSRESEEPPEQPEEDAGFSADEWHVGQLDDVGPAGPATASALGVVMVTKQDQVVVAELKRAPKPHGRSPKARFAPIGLESSAFFPYAPGPALLGEYAYWESSGKLVRRPLARERQLEVLATDARVGARVATPRTDTEVMQDLPPAAAYIAQQGDSLIAKLWVQAAGTHRLSPEGSAANSVALASHPDGLLALALEGRTSMSPVHARLIRFPDGKPRLGKDAVVWVGGTSQQLTEVVVVASGQREASAFLPIERDIAHFGLARIHVTAPPRMNAPVSWRGYPNGLDPAPVACAHLCGQATVAYVRPADQTPRAPQELHLAAIHADGLGASQVIARSRAFANVSLAATPFGGVVAYVADRRTWALVLTCPKQAGRVIQGD